MKITTFLNEEIKCATLVRAPVDRVYDGIATAEGLDGWFTTGARVEAHPGGEIFFRWQDWGVDRINVEESGQVLEAVKPERFVFQWYPDGAASFATTVEIDFETRGNDTVIRLRESGFPDTQAGRRRLLDNATGWGEALTLWKFYIEHGIRY